MTDDISHTQHQIPSEAVVINHAFTRLKGHTIVAFWHVLIIISYNWIAIYSKATLLADPWSRCGKESDWQQAEEDELVGHPTEEDISPNAATRPSSCWRKNDKLHEPAAV